MRKPIILAVDDEPHVLNAIFRDLQSQYRKDYRVLKAESGRDALEAVVELKKRNDAIALFLVDERMPEMCGTAFLAEAMKIYPDTKKVLLTAYADTDVAIESINTINLDYYLMKPWDPPEQILYPVLDDLLGDWQSSAVQPYLGIRVVGTLWSSRCHGVKDFLWRSQIPYQWLDFEKNSTARKLLEAECGDDIQLPTLFFPDGSILVDPDTQVLADKVGLATRARKPYYDVAIIGAGPAGLTAAVYAASEGLKTIVIEKDVAGGQAGTSARIENYPGFPNGISGADLTRRAYTQAKRLGAEIVTAQEVCELQVRDSHRFVVLGDGTELSCKAVLISTGVAVRRLDVPGIEELIGVSAYYGAATSEAKYYQDKKVFVIGGANSAGQGAMFLSRFASEVVLVHRGESLERSMSSYLIRQIEKTATIKTLASTEMIGVEGRPRLEGLVLRHKNSGETQTVAADAVFIFIGAVPSTEFAGSLIAKDEGGYIYTGIDLMQHHPANWKLARDPLFLETSVPGIFAAGDVRHGAIRRVASAVGQGAVAISLIHKYLETV